MPEKRRTFVFLEILGSNKGLENYNYWNLKLHYSTGLYNKIIFVTSDTDIRAQDFDGVEFIKKQFYSTSPLKKSKLYKIYKQISADIKFLALLNSSEEKSVLLNIYGLRAYETFLIFLVRLITKGKLYIVLHDLERLDMGRIRPSLNPFLKLQYLLIYKLVNKILVHSSRIIDAIKFNRMAVDKISFVPHWDFPLSIENVNSVVSQRVDAMINSTADTKFLFLGQINYIKGLDVLLKAASIVLTKGVTNFKIFIFGKSNRHFPSHELTDFIIENGLENYVLLVDEFVPEDEVTPIVLASDVLLLPYTYVYNSGTILKYLGYKKPLIYSNLPSFIDLLAGFEVGVSFKNKDEEDLSKALISMISDRKTETYIEQINMWFESNYNFATHVKDLKIIMD